MSDPNNNNDRETGAHDSSKNINRDSKIGDSELGDSKETRVQESRQRGQDSDELVQTRIGRFEIIEQLGKGGFGFVYLAKDPSLRRNVAIKVPRWDRKLKQKAIDRFLLEGQMLAQANHTSIVSVYDVGTTDDGIPYVVMEYLEGESLSSLLKSERQLPQDVSIALLLRIADALKEAHKQGLVHRDFKPSNVIIHSENRISLVDFGLALHEDLSPEDWMGSEVVGTPAYMAPEQIRGENHLIDGQTDIWAFGVTMYQLLVGSLPFKGEGYRALSRVICYKNPRPLRQLNEQIPKQLERICLRCMQKLMDERYLSMADVIDEINAFVDDQTLITKEDRVDFSDSPSFAGIQESGADSSKQPSTRNPTDSAITDTTSGESTRTKLRLVPKGLRAFDQNDRSFFLSLLPGPTDRNGIPESIRFWNSRLDVVNQVDDVPVGIIYGPSGCGKSSFIRAGLIPTLSENIIPVYVDCTTENLEKRIVRRIHQEVNDVPQDASLSQVMRGIRVGEYLRDGDKLLLLLDQFEQYLNHCTNYDESELTKALRQCDSEKMQSLLLIRDEFWLSASQFMKCLGQRIEESRNAMSLPLFDERHARRVLEAFGRAHGTLPLGDKPLNRQQKKFIKHAVSSLTQRDKVICVHLAVFAESAKSQLWNYSNFKSVGGWEGIGQGFITGIFQNPETPTYITKHSNDAWDILRQLLPETETELKGNAVKRSELKVYSGHQDHSSRFDELMNYLEFDSNLISPVEDSEAIDNDSRVRGSADKTELPDSLYGLTHDFLVKPIRAWGSAKQNETRQGRADSMLNNLSQQWSVTKNARFLPSDLDYANLALFASKNAKLQNKDFWTLSVRNATKRMAMIGAACLLAIVGGWFVWQNMSQLSATQIADRYLNCETDEFAQQQTALARVFETAEPIIRAELDSEIVKRRVRAAAAILERQPNDAKSLEVLFSMVGEIEASEFSFLLKSMESTKASALPVIRKKFDVSKDAVEKSRLALTEAYLGEYGLLEQNFQLVADPIYRTHSIDQIPKWQAGYSKLVQPLMNQASTADGNLISGICCGLSQIDWESLSASEKESCIEFLNLVYTTSPHAGAHTASLHAITQSGSSLPDLDGLPEIADCQWMEVRFPKLEQPDELHRILFVKVPAGIYVVGSGDPDYKPNILATHTGVVDNPIWISAFELPAPIYLDFCTETKTTVDEKSVIFDDEFLANQPSHPFCNFAADALSYENALAFCEWINGKSDLSFLNLDRSDLENEFFLPNCDEFEFSNRAWTDSPFFFGSHEFLDNYIGLSSDSHDRKMNQFMPNGFGLSDTVSNLYECAISKSKFGAGMSTVKGGCDGGASNCFLSAHVRVYPEDIRVKNQGIRLVLKQKQTGIR